MKVVDINTINDEGDPELFVRFGFDGVKVITLFSENPAASDEWLVVGFDIEDKSGNFETVTGANGLDFLNILKQVFDGFYMRASDIKWNKEWRKSLHEYIPLPSKPGEVMATFIKRKK
jgi:hypothetical protein